jgi:hypothetical protein
MTFRQAAKSDFIDGVFVPKGTIFYIPVRIYIEPVYVMSIEIIVDSRHQHLETDLGRGCGRV